MSSEINVQISANAQSLVNAASQSKEAITNMTSSINNSLSNIANQSAQLASSLSAATSKIQSTASAASSATAAQASATGQSIGKIGVDMNLLGSQVANLESLITGSFSAIAAGALAMGIAVFASAIKGGVDATVEFTKENNKLARQMGITGSEASVMNIALKNIGSSGSDYGDGLSKLNKQLKTNEVGLKALGVETRNQDGSLKTGEQAMKSAVETLGSFKTGQDQAQFAMYAFGKGAEESLKFLKLTPEVMAKARIETEALGLVMSKTAQDDVAKYREALKHVDNVNLGLKNTVGEALIPILTQSAEWFASIGPTAVELMREAMSLFTIAVESVIQIFKTLWSAALPIFKSIGEVISGVFGQGGEGPTAMEFFHNVMRVLQMGIVGLRIGFEIASTLIVGAISGMSRALTGLAEVAVAVYNGIKNRSLAGIANAFSEANKAVKADIQKTVNDIVKISEKGKADLDKIAMGDYRAKDTAPIAAKKMSVGKDFVAPEKGGGGAGGKDNAKQLRDAEYALLKAQERAKIDLFKEQEKEELLILENLYARKKITIEEYYRQKQAMQDADFLREIDSKKREIANNQSKVTNDPVEKIKILTETVKLTNQLNVLQEKQKNTVLDNARALETENEKLKLNNDLRTVQRNLAIGQNGIALEKVSTDQMLALKQIDNKKALQMNEERENKIYALLVDSARKRRELAAGDVVKQSEIDDELLDLERNHTLKIAEVRSSMVLEAEKDNIKLYETAQNGLASMFESMTKGQKGLKAGFTDLFNTITSALIKMGSEQLAKKIMDASGLSSSMGKSSEGGIMGMFSGLFSGGGGQSSGGGFFSSLMNGIGSLFGSAKSYDVGTSYVQGDQFAKIHNGERILTKAENASGSYKNSGSSQQIVVNNTFKSDGATDRRTQGQFAGLAAMTMKSVAVRYM